MLTDMDDDFFYEEDKIDKITQDDCTPLLQIDELTLTQPIKQPRLNADGESTSISKDNLNQTQSAASETDIIFGNTMKFDIAYAGEDVADSFFEFSRQKFELQRLGMTVTTSCVVVTKDKSNLIGISIGGGAPACPCLYIVQIFDGTPAALEGSLQSGDELLAVNSVSVKGKTKVEVAKMIQSASTDVTIHYNKLHADPVQGKSLDIILKKLKHRIVDNMSSNTADSLGLSRAILCNDSLVKRLEELEGTEFMYKGLVEHARRMVKAFYDLLQTYKSFGDCFSQISTREPQQRASEAFRVFGEFHRNLEKDGLCIIKDIKPVLMDLGTYLNKAIPDTKLTVRRYTDAKFTYLSYCLKVKEMDDEEHGFAALQESLYRVETGNYEYRLILRCRQDARAKFAKLRTDVLEKMELLECKHATDLNKQLRSLLDSLSFLNKTVAERIDTLPPLFPIEVDFKETDFQYKSSTLKPQELDDDEIAANLNISTSEIACGFEAVEQPATIYNFGNNSASSEKVALLSDFVSTISLEEKPPKAFSNDSANESLLKELGIFGIDLMVNPKTITNQSESISAQKDTYDFDLFLNQTVPPTTQLEKDLMTLNAAEMDLLLQ